MTCLPGLKVLDFLSVSTCVAYASSVSTLKQFPSAGGKYQFDQSNLCLLEILGRFCKINKVIIGVEDKKVPKPKILRTQKYLQHKVSRRLILPVMS